jgi:hypothetical protein
VARLRLIRFARSAVPTVGLAVAALFIAMAPRTLCAQRDTGRVETLRLVGVLDANTGDWIDRAIIRDTLGDETFTSRFGVATLNVLTPIAGFYLLEIRKEGYAPRRIRLRADTSFQIMFALEPNPLGTATQLPAVVTTERQRLQNDPGERHGFFERCQTKTVQCIGRVELDKDPTGTLYNMLHMKNGIHPACVATYHGPVWTKAADVKYDDEIFGCLITMRNATPPPEYCSPTYFVDGFEWQPLAGRAQAQIDQFLPPKRIEGIEVYLANQPHPPRFSPPLFDGCGAIVIWTR